MIDIASFPVHITFYSGMLLRPESTNDHAVRSFNIGLTIPVTCAAYINSQLERLLLDQVSSSLRALYGVA
jgi:hypothetical protein